MHYWEGTFLFRNKIRRLRLPDDSTSTKRAEKIFRMIAKERRWKFLYITRQRL